MIVTFSITHCKFAKGHKDMSEVLGGLMMLNSEFDSLVTLHPKTNRSAIPGILADKLANGFEDHLELLIILTFQLPDFGFKVSIGLHPSAKCNKCSHDAHIHMNGSITSQNTG